MPDLLDFQVDPTKTKFGSLIWNPALALIKSLFAGKADYDHTHGEGGPVVGIGLSTARPTQQPGFIHVETDTGQVVMYLNADGSSVKVLASQQFVQEYVDLKPIWPAWSSDPDMNPAENGFLVNSNPAFRWPVTKMSHGQITDIRAIVELDPDLDYDIVMTAAMETANAGTLDLKWYLFPLADGESPTTTSWPSLQGSHIYAPGNHINQFTFTHGNRIGSGFEAGDKSLVVFRRYTTNDTHPGDLQIISLGLQPVIPS